MSYSMMWLRIKKELFLRVTRLSVIIKLESELSHLFGGVVPIDGLHREVYGSCCKPLVKSHRPKREVTVESLRVLIDRPIILLS